jgi:hypothetical protein
VKEEIKKRILEALGKIPEGYLSDLVITFSKLQKKVGLSTFYLKPGVEHISLYSQAIPWLYSSEDGEIAQCFARADGDGRQRIL